MGRKRHLRVDMRGLIPAVTVLPANILDRDGAKMMLRSLRDRYSRVKRVGTAGDDASQLIA
ncbi:MAG: hypothetical protein JO355_04625 [Planctomycetaceae bacterium]|nr:hypothetical protein [Planctomycetaceae bacterium]MBV8266687.1 hypothetical protein [Planctomycetaceae bacterium]MBV8318304.1 hypothetical protein [Planctomycetaceae bacterium]MBV8606779.1 hypothetical protein [Singulisphaera sp.]MBV8676440.1 hypothetical protein [Planctomycetaceae bacterium]